MQNDQHNKDQIQDLKSLPKRLISPGVHARILRNEKGRLELAIICDETTTAEDLRKAWPVIDRIRQRLLNQQGTDPTNFSYLTKMQIASMHIQEHFSYAEIAMDLNYDSLCNLVSAVEHWKSGELQEAREMCWAVYIRLEALGMKHDDIHEWINQSLAAIKQGRAPWSLVDGPVDKQRVVDAIRQVVREVENGKLVIKQRTKMKMVDVNILEERNRGTWETAQALLRQLPDAGGYNRLHEAHRRNPLPGVDNPG